MLCFRRVGMQALGSTMGVDRVVDGGGGKRENWTHHRRKQAQMLVFNGGVVATEYLPLKTSDTSSSRRNGFRCGREVSTPPLHAEMDYQHGREVRTPSFHAKFGFPPNHPRK